MLLTADRVLTPEGTFTPGWLRVDGTEVAEVGEGGPPCTPDVALTGTVVPGFVDIHCHGGGGASFATGSSGHVEQAHVERAAAAHLRHGTTSLVASLVTDEVGTMEREVAALVGHVRAGRLAGVHLEGPWLSRSFCGAHEPELLRDPDPADVDRLLTAGEGTVRMVTLAPELDGAIDAIRRITEAGAVAALGHTDASYEQTRAAIGAGATAATHLFNAMGGLHHRQPGPVAALLEDESVWIELICDGVHVHPALLRLARSAAPGRLMLVTDAMSAAAAEDGYHALGPVRVQVRDGVARTPEGALAGSTLTMDAAVRHAVASGFTLEQAVDAASRAPAAALGLTDVGQLRAGARADLVVLDDDLHVTRVLHSGGWVHG